MGARKRQKAEQRKEARKKQYTAVLHDCPTSPRKMRLMADIIRGTEINRALDILKFSTKEASNRLEKLVLSAVANWQNKNVEARIEDSQLYIKEVYVDQSRTLKRISPAPQGRAYRKRKRSNHVTVIVGSKNGILVEEVNETESHSK